MADEVMASCQPGDVNQPGYLRKAVETLRARFSSIRVEMLMANGDATLSVRFVGDTRSAQDRQLLVSSLAECLPPALSILGIKPEQKHGDEGAASTSKAS